MRPRASAVLLAQLAGIRVLQQQAAEAAAARAAIALAQAEDDLGKVEMEEEVAERGWHQELAMPQIALDLLLIKSRALLNCDASVVEAKDECDHARDEQATKRGQLLKAMLLSRSAKGMAREAARYETEKREEARLAETLDRFRTKEVFA